MQILQIRQLKLGLDRVSTIVEDQHKRTSFAHAYRQTRRPGRDREALGENALKLPLWGSALSATLLVQIVSSFAAAAVPLLGPM